MFDRQHDPRTVRLDAVDRRLLADFYSLGRETLQQCRHQLRIVARHRLGDFDDGHHCAEPVAMTMRRALTVRLPAASWRGPTKRASARITSTPKPSNRSTES